MDSSFGAGLNVLAKGFALVALFVLVCLCVLSFSLGRWTNSTQPSTEHLEQVGSLFAGADDEHDDLRIENAQFGAIVRYLNKGPAKGLQVQAVFIGSYAARTRILVGDILTQVGYRPGDATDEPTIAWLKLDEYMFRKSLPPPAAMRGRYVFRVYRETKGAAEGPPEGQFIDLVGPQR